MRTRSRIVQTFAILGISGTLLMAQHAGGGGHAGGVSAGGGHAAGFGGGTHSAGIGTHSAGIGPSAIQPYHSPLSIAGSANSFTRATPAYPGVYGNRYIGNAYSYGRGRNAGQYRPGPWRANSRYGRYGYVPYYGLYAPYFSYLGTPYYGDYNSFDNSNDTGGYGPPPDDPNFDPNGPALPPNDNGLGNQMAQLNDQLNDLRGRLDQSQQPPTPYRASSPEPAAPVPPVSVVLNSGKILQIQSYAVVGDTFWDFSSQPARKIPLSSIDVPASTKASEASGAEFPQIKAGR